VSSSWDTPDTDFTALDGKYTYFVWETLNTANECFQM
jgi:hypothetical protein